MKKGKHIGFILLMAFFALIALGSGSSNTRGNTKKISSVESSGSSSKSSPTSKDISSVSSDANDDTHDTALSENETADASTGEMSINETVILNQDNILVTATGMSESTWGPELKLLIENNTNQGLTFQVRNASVNGYMVDTMMSTDIAAGKKANTEVTFTTSGLKACGITTFANIEFSLHVFDSDTWDTVLDSQPISLNTAAAATYTQQYDDSGAVFYDQNGIKIVGKGLSSEGSVFGPGLVVYIENNTNTDFTVQVRDTSINGFMVDTAMSEDVIAGKKALTAVTFFSSSLEENNITDIQSIETSFHVFDMDNWDTIVDTSPIIVNF